jgi:hypothetical protein
MIDFMADGITKQSTLKRQLETKEIEAKLAAEAGPSPADAHARATAPPAPKLSATNLESDGTGEPHEERHYGRDKGDFYPTEVHKSHPEEDR